MDKRSVLGIGLATALLSHPLQAQGEAARLYEEARALVEQTEGLPPPSEQLRLLQRAEANLQAILENHPESAEAAQLVLGDRLQRTIELSLAQALERDAMGHRECHIAPSADCLIEIALSYADQALIANVSEDVIAQRYIGALASIAHAIAEGGMYDVSNRVFAKALSHADSLFHSGNEHVADVSYTRISAWQLPSSLRDSFATLRRVGNPHEINASISRIIEEALVLGCPDFVASATKYIIDERYANSRPHMLIIDAMKLGLNVDIELHRGLNNKVELATGLRILARMQARKGDRSAAHLFFTDAAEILISTNFAGGSQWNLYSIISNMIDADLLEEASDLIPYLTDYIAEANAASLMGLAYFDRGNTAEARGWLARAMAIAMLNEGWARDRNLQFLVRSQAHIGAISESLNTLNQIDAVSDKAIGYANIAAGLARNSPREDEGNDRFLQKEECPPPV